MIGSVTRHKGLRECVLSGLLVAFSSGAELLAQTPNETRAEDDGATVGLAPTELWQPEIDQDPRRLEEAASSLPLWEFFQLEWVGAFRLPASDFGESSANWAEGPLAVDRTRDSLYLVGHSDQQAIAEFKIPKIVGSKELARLAIAPAPIQVFRSVLNRASKGNPQNLDRIAGMALIDPGSGAELLVNAYEYYDADGNNNQSTFAVRRPGDLRKSQVDGFYRFRSGAAPVAGWISPIPSQWQSILGGSYLTGHSSGIPIISRTTVGPSAFAIHPSEIVGQASPNVLSSTRLLEYSLAKPLHSDLENTSRKNKLWTHTSRAVYGFIPPGTRTYLVLGSTSGHQSGICYKCTQDDGNLCGGYCPRSAKDRSNYYWLYDLDALVQVKKGLLPAHRVQPYAYGVWKTPFEDSPWHVRFGGGTFDPDSGLLYVSLLEADNSQGQFARPPLVMVFRFEDPDPPRRMTNGPLQSPP